LNNLNWIDLSVLIGYGIVLIGMGAYFMRKSKTADGFMVADRSLPAWVVGLAIMGAYTSSISYIATPGKSYDTDWHPWLFALAIPPVTWAVNRWVVPYYRRLRLISVYGFLETRLGNWARFYGSLSFLLYMVGRAAVILYLSAIVMQSFVGFRLEFLILIIGLVTIIYTLLGGLEAVVWADVLQSIIMIGGALFCVGYLTYYIAPGPDSLLSAAWEAGKFNLGRLDWNLDSRTVLVMIIYGVTENLRNLIADQNYVQKYAAATTEKEAKRSLWVSAAIFIPLNGLFLYIGVALFAFYALGGHPLDPSITKGDQVFPYFIATQIPIGIRGLIIAAILSAAMSTISSTFNCSATVSLLDFYKRYFKPDVGDRASVVVLRLATVFWGGLGTVFALLMIHARSALDTWWQISGIFGGGILGLFILALMKIRLTTTQGILAVSASIFVIIWGTFIRGDAWWQSRLEEIIVGAVATFVLLGVALALASLKRAVRT